MIEAWGELNVRETFAEAARAFTELVQRIPDDRWDGPGLGEWDLRALVGHTSRSLITVETYLGRPADSEEVPTPAAYYVAIAGTDHAAVAVRGLEAGQALGENPAQFVDELRMRVLAQVHSLDIAKAVPDIEPPEFSDQLLSEVARVSATAAVLLGHGVALLLALTGREPASPGFSMV
jgi:hypothetical protein